jgi:thiamine transport system permease protein
VDRPHAALTRAARWALPLAFVALFFLFPLLTVLARGLRPEGRWDLTALTNVVTDPGLRGVVVFTVWQAALSTALTLVVGLPAAWVLARRRFRGRSVVEAGVLVPFVLPTVVVGMAFSIWAGSLAAILVAHMFLNVAVVVRIVGGAWAELDPDIEEAAAALGAGPWERARRVLLPMARPAIAGAATLVFLFCFTSFGVVLFLGGPGLTTIEVEIYRQTAQLLDLPTAAALAIVQLAFVGGLLALDAVAATRGVVARRPGGAASGTARPPRGSGERVATAAVLLLLAALILVPVGRLVARSFASADGFTLDHYLHLGSVREGSVLAVSPLAAIRNSLRAAAAATAIALAIGGLAAAALARARRASGAWALLGLPLGVSAVTVGLGYVLAFSRPPLELRGSPWLVPLVQAVVAIPFVVRIVGPALAEIDRDLAETAADLGAPPRRVTLDVTLPLAARAIATAAVFAFVISLGEFGATAFVARADHPTMPIAIARLLSQPGAASLGQATAMAVLLMVVTGGVALAIGRSRRVF